MPIPQTIQTAIRRVIGKASPSLVESIVRWRSTRVAAQKEKKYWEDRITDVLACPDNLRLSHHPAAGKVRGGFQTMFNGLRVVTDGYYGRDLTNLLRRYRGSHEPQ